MNRFAQSDDYLLIRQPFIASQQIDDTAICEAVLQDVVLHDLVVAMGVYADVRVM